MADAPLLPTGIASVPPRGVKVREDDGGRVVLELRRRRAVPPEALWLVGVLTVTSLTLQTGDLSRVAAWMVVPAVLFVAAAVSVAMRAAAAVLHRSTVAADAVAVEVHERPLSEDAGVLVASATIRAVRVEAAEGRRSRVSVVAETAEGARQVLVRDAGSPEAAIYVADRIAAAIRPSRSPGDESPALARGGAGDARGATPGA